MAIRCRGQERMGGLFTGIQIKQITEASKLVAEYSGMAVQPHKAIVGAHAFEHSSGIHQDGMLKFKGTYEFLSPEDIGLTRTNTLGIVLGKHSGRHALKTRLQQIGYNLDPEALNEIFKRFKVVADKKKRILDADLEALLSDTSFEPQHQWSLIYVQVVSGTSGSVTATIKLRELNEIEHTSCSSGTDAVDAAFKAVNNIVKTPASVLEYSFSSKTEGHDTLISTRVVISSGKTLNGHIFSGTDTSGICVDIVESSVRAYLNAINRMIVSKGFK